MLLRHSSVKLSSAAAQPSSGTGDFSSGSKGRAEFVLPALPCPAHCSFPSLQTIDVEKSFVSMVPAKVEITLCKAGPGSWARLELPQSKLQSCGEQEKEAANTEEPGAVLDEDSDDSLSWSEEEDEEWEMEAPDMITPSN